MLVLLYFCQIEVYILTLANIKHILPQNLLECMMKIKSFVDIYAYSSM